MIRVENLTRRYGTVPAVTGVTLCLDRNEILVVLGPSGGGKTSLLRLIAGFERPDGGGVEIDGVQVSSPRTLTPPNRRGLGMIFQDLALWPHLTAQANVAFGLRGRGESRRTAADRAAAMLGQVALAEHRERFPHQLSGGERQRLAIARALAPEPAYLLMDEPFGRLDPVLKGEMIHLLRSLKDQRRMGVVYVTHNLDEALTLADRIVVMNRGRLAGAIAKPALSSLTAMDLLAWYTACV